MHMTAHDAPNGMVNVLADAGAAAGEMSGQEMEYCAEVDGQLAWVRVDGAATAELEVLDAPNLLRVQYQLTAADEDGLPTAREEALLAQLREELAEWVSALGGRHVGEACCAGHCTWFFYVPCGWLEAANLVHRIGLRRNVVLGVEMMPDATHRCYHEGLLPSWEELRRMQTARQLAELAQQGDDGEQPRPVVHELRFDNRVQALACAEWARRSGLVVDGLLPPADGQPHYRLLVHRHMALEPVALDEDIRRVAEAAQRLGGDYIGWRAEVCQPMKHADG